MTEEEKLEIQKEKVEKEMQENLIKRIRERSKKAREVLNLGRYSE